METKDRIRLAATHPPIETLRPTSEAEVQDFVRQAVSDGVPMMAVGGATRLACGNSLRTEKWRAIDTTALTDGFDFSPDDMVVTAGAGTTMAQLSERLKAKGQFLPLDVPNPELATVGGVISANTHGLWRPVWGSVRDRLIGIRTVTGNGDVVKSGGRVVKNVAGYDLGKLWTGAYGTLGIVVQATFRTSPLPQAIRWGTFRAESAAQAAEALLEVQRARLQPVTAQVVCSGGQEFVCIGLHGSEKQVAWQKQAIAATLRLPEFEGETEETVRNLMENIGEGSRLRIVVSPSEVPAVLHQLVRASCVSASVPVGVVEVLFGAEIDPVQMDAELRKALDSRTAVLTWTHLPVRVQGRMSPWSETGSVTRLHQGVKQALDPHGVFSPGRFVGGL